ncbi:MAG: hypothetical protein KF889_16985 [Alphaproteobacteria bacterium]|nr:hypothetical protein [Alphaproteobacteria bacterium]MCW5739934.1 hypothetical protein [Alphaproteobacteria bacterium]
MAEDQAARIHSVVSQLETTLSAIDRQLQLGFDDEVVTDAMRTLREVLCTAIREGVSGLLISHDQASGGRIPVALPVLVGEAVRSG